MDAKQYADKAENFLPVELADFHDQKDFFKTLQELYGEHEAFRAMPNSWVNNHVFSVDFLLYFFAMHGYKLQKIRTKGVEFCDLATTLKHYNDQRRAKSTEMLTKAFSCKPTP